MVRWTARRDRINKCRQSIYTDVPGRWAGAAVDQEKRPKAATAALVSAWCAGGTFILAVIGWQSWRQDFMLDFRQRVAEWVAPASRSDGEERTVDNPNGLPVRIVSNVMTVQQCEDILRWVASSEAEGPDAANSPSEAAGTTIGIGNGTAGGAVIIPNGSFGGKVNTGSKPGGTRGGTTGPATRGGTTGSTARGGTTGSATRGAISAGNTRGRISPGNTGQGTTPGNTGQGIGTGGSAETIATDEYVEVAMECVRVE